MPLNQNDTMIESFPTHPDMTSTTTEINNNPIFSTEILDNFVGDIINQTNPVSSAWMIHHGNEEGTTSTEDDAIDEINNIPLHVACGYAEDSFDISQDLMLIPNLGSNLAFGNPSNQATSSLSNNAITTINAQSNSSQDNDPSFSSFSSQIQPPCSANTVISTTFPSLSSEFTSVTTIPTNNLMTPTNNTYPIPEISSTPQTAISSLAPLVPDKSSFLETSQVMGHSNIPFFPSNNIENQVGINSMMHEVKSMESQNEPLFVSNMVDMSLLDNSFLLDNNGSLSKRKIDDMSMPSCPPNLFLHEPFATEKPMLAGGNSIINQSSMKLLNNEMPLASIERKKAKI